MPAVTDSMHIEDSPSCPREEWSACPHSDCVLLDFVPLWGRSRPVPCRYIPLNDNGESLEMLYSTGTNEEIQETLRQWLLKTIARLEQQVALESAGERSTWQAP